jgi:hypothetical protein
MRRNWQPDASHAPPETDFTGLLRYFVRNGVEVDRIPVLRIRKGRRICVSVGTHSLGASIESEMLLLLDGGAVDSGTSACNHNGVNGAMVVRTHIKFQSTFDSKYRFDPHGTQKIEAPHHKRLLRI